MAIRTTYSHARENLASLWDQVEANREVAIISRRGHSELALIEASELRSLEETAHLLRSPANALRLLTALENSRQGKGMPFSVAELREELGIGPEEE